MIDILNLCLGDRWTLISQECKIYANFNGRWGRNKTTFSVYSSVCLSKIYGIVDPFFSPTLSGFKSTYVIDNCNADFTFPAIS